jgi:hypothetical protein
MHFLSVKNSKTKDYLAFAISSLENPFLATFAHSLKTPLTSFEKQGKHQMS